MNSKVSSVLEKSLQDKAKGNYHRALKRLSEALERHADEVELYLEAADVCLEGGESLQATQYLKRAYSKFSSEKERIDGLARDKLRKLGDPVLGKFLLDQAIKRRDLEAGREILEDLQDRTIRELLQRARTKRQTLSNAARGGHALKSEMVLNVLGEALLCLRLGRMKAAVQSFIELLDEKPVENEVLEPFFSGLERKYPKAGRIRFAYACSLIYAQQYDKAMSRLVQGVKLEPTVADEALDRLRALTETFEQPPPSLQDALVEILLAKGDVLRAGDILSESLGNDPAQAKRVMALMQPYVEQVSDSLVLHYLYMDAALAADQTRRVLEKLKLIRQSEQHRDDLYQWLETKSSEQFLPADVMILHGEMALEFEHTDRAIEIFEAVIGNSPGDAHTVLTTLEKHKSGDPKLAEFYDEQAKILQADAPRQADDGSGFEHFENKEFKFSSESKEELQLETADEGPVAEPNEATETMVAPVELDSGRYTPEKYEEARDGATEPVEGGAAKSPLELGLERAAEFAVKGSEPDILWEEEDADGVVESGSEKKGSPAGGDDAWLVQQSDTVMGNDNTMPTSASTSSPQEPAAELPPEEPEADTPLAVPVDQTPPEEPEADTPLAVPVDQTPPEEPEAETPPEEPTVETQSEHTEETDVSSQQAETAPISEGHVVKLAESLRTVGARLFFHVQDEAPQPSAHVEDAAETVSEPDSEPADEPTATDSDHKATEASDQSQTEDDPSVVTDDADQVTDGEAESDVEVAEPADAPMASGPKTIDPFQERFEHFLDGKLDHDAILDLIAEALERGSYDEARELLHFQPRNDAEELARKRHLVDYHMSVDRPSTAIDIIESIDADALPDDAKRDILVKLASCFNKLSDFESAQAVYDNIAREFPSEEIEKLAKRNNERIIERQRSGALVLEKTTSLQDD
jgi:tetratricopeptide (TPR) repeat protein